MFRRSGSFACYHVEGSTPDPQTEEFLSALAENRFRTIENAADEQTSVGWVTAGDPSGNTFEREDLEQEGAVWLRMRIDKKSAPNAWLRIYRDAAEKSAGRKLSAKERKELKEDLMSKLMPRVLPTIKMIDALYVPKEKTILLFGTSNAVREAFLSLVYRTFALSLIASDPYNMAVSLGLSPEQKDALSDVAPVRWPTGGSGAPSFGDRPLPVAESTDAEVLEQDVTQDVEMVEATADETPFAEEETTTEADTVAETETVTEADTVAEDPPFDVDDETERTTEVSA